MSEHDPESGQQAAGPEARPTPYDLIFAPTSFDEAEFELLRDQALSRRAVTPTDLAMLPAAAELVRALLPEAVEGAQHSAIVAQVRALLFHAFRFWLHGKRVLALDEATMRELLTRDEPIGEWQLSTPAPAGYVQLPRNLLWARVAEDAAAEPIDGFFWSAPTRDEGVRGERLDLLLALGVRRGRPGLSLVDASIEEGGPLTHWADVDARPGGTDFDNMLPGGELHGYHALTTQAEILKLAARVFWRLDPTRRTGDG